MPDGGGLVAALSSDCRAEGMTDLADSMTKIENFVNEWWTQTLMPWFTDHGPKHSRRVAEFALTIGAIPDLHAPHALTTLEKYILWASSWLHDLGMQTLPSAALGDLSGSDFERVRHDHPAQSAFEIKKRAGAIGLPENDLPLVQIVSWVARAHGTAYFEDTLGLLSKVPYVRNQPVRGGLLAAIVLLADEMDLHYERVSNLPLPWGQLSTVAEAHAYKHKHVLESRIVHVGGRVELAMTLFRSEDTAADAVDLEKWITHKLRRQVALVEDAFTGGFNGRVSLSRAIRVTRIEGWGPVPLADRAAMLTVRADNARSDLINHNLALTELEASIARREVTVVTGQLAEQFIDVDGREDLVSVAVARARLGGATVLTSTRLYESAGAATIADIKSEWASCLEISPTSAAMSLDERLAELDGHVLVTVSSADLLPRDEFTSLLAAITELADSVGDLSVILTTDPGTAPKNCDFVVPADGLIAEDVANYLASFVPWQTARNESLARLRYSDYRRLGQQHLLSHEVEGA